MYFVLILHPSLINFRTIDLPTKYDRNFFCVQRWLVKGLKPNYSKEKKHPIISIWLPLKREWFWLFSFCMMISLYCIQRLRLRSNQNHANHLPPFNLAENWFESKNLFFINYPFFPAVLKIFKMKSCHQMLLYYVENTNSWGSIIIRQYQFIRFYYKSENTNSSDSIILRQYQWYPIMFSISDT